MWSHSQGVPRGVRVTDTGRRWWSQGLGEGGRGACDGDAASVWDGEEVLEVAVGTAAQQCACAQRRPTAHLQMVNVCYVCFTTTKIIIGTYYKPPPHKKKRLSAEHVSAPCNELV